MLEAFIVVSFAAFIGYQIFRTLLPFIPLSARTAPLFVFAIACGFTLLTPHPSALIAAASTGGVALLNKITDVGAPEQWNFTFRRPNISVSRLKIRRHETVDESKIGHRIKSL